MVAKIMKVKGKNNDGVTVLASNRRARYEYEVIDRFEAGIVLRGTEVKAARTGNIQLKDSFVEFVADEAWLVGTHFSPYSHGNRENHEPERRRKLLLRRRELDKLQARAISKGFSIVPLSVYLKGNHIKVEIALVQGKKLHDKRQAIRERDLDREAHEAMKSSSRS